MEEYGLQACVSILGRHLINFRKEILEQVEDKERVIDRDGFRLNVGIVVCNDEDQVLWGRRINGRDSWQFPQGGMNRDESPEAAMYRELEERWGCAQSQWNCWAAPRAGFTIACPSGSSAKPRTRSVSARSRFGFCFVSQALRVISIWRPTTTLSSITGSG